MPFRGCICRFFRFCLSISGTVSILVDTCRFVSFLVELGRYVNILGAVFAGITSRNSNYYNSKYKYYYQNYYGKDVDPSVTKPTDPMKDEEEKPQQPAEESQPEEK